MRVLCPTCGETSQIEAIEVPPRGRLLMCDSCDLIWTVRPHEILPDGPVIGSASAPAPVTPRNAAPSRPRRYTLAATAAASVLALAATVGLAWNNGADVAEDGPSTPRIAIVGSEVQRDASAQVLTIKVTLANEGTRVASAYDVCVRLLNRRAAPLFNWCQHVADRTVEPGARRLIELQLVSPPPDMVSAEVHLK